MAVANLLAPCALLILTVLLKSNDLTDSIYQENCFSWSNCRSVTRSFLEWVPGVHVYSRKGTRMPSAILDSKCKSRFVTLYILLICGDINPNPGFQWKFPSGVCHKPVKSNHKGIQCDYCDRWYHSKCCMDEQRRLLSDWLFESLLFSLLTARKIANKGGCHWLPLRKFLVVLLRSFVPRRISGKSC